MPHLFPLWVLTVIAASSRHLTLSAVLGLSVEKKLQVATRSVVRATAEPPEGVQKVMKECLSRKLSASLIEVHPEYYNWTLQERWCVTDLDLCASFRVVIDSHVSSP